MQQRISEIRKDPTISSRLEKEKFIDTSDEKACISFCESHEPVLSVILVLQQGELEELIEILSKHLSKIAKNPEDCHWITKWIYASLACLRSPLDPEVHNCLRMIAKSCIQITSRLKTLPEAHSDSFPALEPHHRRHRNLLPTIRFAEFIIQVFIY